VVLAKSDTEKSGISFFTEEAFKKGWGEAHKQRAEERRADAEKCCLYPLRVNHGGVSLAACGDKMSGQSGIQ